MEDEEMGKLLRKNFDTFVSTEKYNIHLKEQDDDEEEENKDEKQEKKPKKHDFFIYKRLSENNGKKEAQMLKHFLIQLFDQDKAIIEQFVPKYLENLSSTRMLGKANFSDGIS